MLWRKYNRIIDRDQLLGWWSFSKLWIWELVDKKAWGNLVGEGFLWRLKNSQHNTQYYEFLAPNKRHSFDVFTSLHICSEQHLSTCYQFHILSLCLLMTYPLKRKGPSPWLWEQSEGVDCEKSKGTDKGDPNSNIHLCMVKNFWKDNIRQLLRINDRCLPYGRKADLKTDKVWE